MSVLIDTGVILVYGIGVAVAATLLQRDRARDEVVRAARAWVGVCGPRVGGKTYAALRAAVDAYEAER